MTHLASDAGSLYCLRWVSLMGGRRVMVATSRFSSRSSQFPVVVTVARRLGCACWV